MQRSAESSVLVSSPHFAPGGASKLLIKVTRVLVFVFICNCLFMSYMKYGYNKNADNVKSSNPVSTKNASVPVD